MNLFCYTKNILARRKGISQIIGSLFMLAIVVPIGTVILSQGLYEITDFNKFLSTSGDQGIAAVQEDIIFEHIRFEPTGDQVTISVRNISPVESFIEKITIVRMAVQPEILTMTAPDSCYLALPTCASPRDLETGLSAFLQLAAFWHAISWFWELRPQSSRAPPTPGYHRQSQQ